MADILKIEALEVDPDDSAELVEINRLREQLKEESIEPTDQVNPTDPTNPIDQAPEPKKDEKKFPKYTLPSPTVYSEANRLSDQHHLWLGVLKGRLSVTHVPTTAKRILEVGGGTGIWSMDFASTHPNTEVIAIDTEKIPRYTLTTNKCHYFVFDAQADWRNLSALDGPFDFIHLRCMGVVFRDWHRLFAQCFERLTPGGWIEIQDIKYPVRSLETFPKPQPALLRGYSHMPEICKTRDVDIMAVNHFEKYFRDCGFVNIKEESPQMAIGCWPKGEEQKKIGSEQLKMLFRPHWVTLMTMMYEKALGWTPAAVEQLVDEVRQDVLTTGRHYYHQL